MNVKRNIQWAARALAAGLLALGGLQAQATTLATEWGVIASTNYADCSLIFCDLVSLPALLSATPTSQSGGLNQTSAAGLNVNQTHQTLEGSTVDMGDTSAQVDISTTGVNVPVLRASASSNGLDGWTTGLAFAVQVYEYTGAGSTTINLNATLDGTVVNNGGYDITSLSVGIWLLKEDPLNPLSFPGGMASSVGALTGAIVLNGLLQSAWTPADSTTTGPVSVSTSPGDLVIALDPGEQFFLMAGLTAGSLGAGNSAVSFSTLTMGFDTTELIAAGVPVPLPPAAGLLGAAMAGLMLVRRRTA